MRKLACLALLLVLLLVVKEIHALGYCSICKDHTMCTQWLVGAKCLGHRKFWGVNRWLEKQQILEIHNRYRRRVAAGLELRGDPGPQPPASNMNALEWDNELQMIAQRWANQCNFGHDKCRNTERYGWVGQNLYINGVYRSNGVKPNDDRDWETAIAAFYNEVKYLSRKNVDKMGSVKSRNATGHYTQLVWAKTTHVGCGYTSYTENRNGKEWFQKYYVCNYGPGGNVIGQKVYEKGFACTKCGANRTCRLGLCYPSLPLLSMIFKTVLPRIYTYLFDH